MRPKFEVSAPARRLLRTVVDFGHMDELEVTPFLFGVAAELGPREHVVDLFTMRAALANYLGERPDIYEGPLAGDWRLLFS